MRKKLLLLLYFSFGAAALFAQNKDVFVLKQIDTSKNAVPLDTLWKFQAGDKTEWSQPSFNDTLWETLGTELEISTACKKNFTGMCWYRLHVSVPEKMRHQPIAIVMSQLGASDIFVDGKLLQSFGHPDPDKTKEIKYTPNGLPLIFEFGDGEFHVIAVRYSNHLEQDIIEKPGHLTAGFSMALRNTKDAVTATHLQTTILDIFSTFLATFYFTLGFVHFLLFLFYRKQKTNLFYSIFITLFAIFFLLPLLEANSTNPENQELYGSLLVFNIPLFFTALLGFIYSMFYESVPKRFRTFCITLIVLIILDLLKVSTIGYAIFCYMCVVAVVSLVEVILAFYRKKKGAWVVGTATISFLLLILALLLKNALGFGNGIYVQDFNLTGIFLLALVLLAILSIPFSMSLYLAREFSSTNKDLEHKLVEVKNLSERSIEQEKEKQKILETQKEVLEVQVEERTHEIVEQKKVIEEKNKDITDSINYAKRIQEAILPPKELKYELFPEAFVLLKPKDIVSGDFYWFTEKNGKKIIAACDCTGHGVPGALMSMIGNNFLNQIVNEQGTTSPGEILSRLHEEVRKSLKQNMHAENRDGMDVAMISITGEGEIEFAGAQRPLWIVRNGVLEEIKPNKFSIGGLQMENNRTFTTHKITIQKNDCLYICSDGYADQFGGEEGKKFMSKNFKELLIAVHKEPMMKQESIIDETIEKWKGSREQIDDILVIGIKI